MKSALALCLALIAPAAAAAQSAVPLREVRFSGPSAADELCACLLDLRRSAESQGRLPLPVVDRPPERRAQVAALRLQPIDPPALLGAREAGLRPLR